MPVVVKSAMVNGSLMLMIDTAASQTALLDKDLVRYQVDVSRLTPASSPIIGVGGDVRTFQIKDVELRFKSDDGFLTLRQDIVAIQHDRRRLSESIRNRVLVLQSVLGLDILNQFRLTVDFKGGVVQMESHD